MGFNGKSLIVIGFILFIFQIANFFSIKTITPELERAQVLAAIGSLIIILIGFLFKQFEPLAEEKADLKGENKFLFDNSIPDEFIPGETCLRSIKDMKLISLANTKFYPGREEFFNFCQGIPSVLVVPINKKAFILIGGWSAKCFTKSDEKWINNWSKKINNIFSNNNI